jgi:hypothetical protein
MRKALLAAGAALALIGGGAHATVFANHQIDKAGDFLAGFPQADRAANGDLDFTDFAVSFDDATGTFDVTVTLADDINKTQAGAYVIGIDTGKGGHAPFGGVGEPNVLFDQALTLQKDGTGVLSLITPDGKPAGSKGLNAVMGPQGFSVEIKLADLTPTGLLAPQDFGFNAWSKKGSVLADFAPNNRLLSAAVPEPATWAMLVGGFAVIGGSLRRRRASNARLLTV